MPEAALPQTPATPKAPPSSTPPGGTPTSATASEPPPAATAPPAQNSAEFRYPDSPDIAPWARGKTAMEVLQVARGYEEAFNTGRSFAAPQAQVPAPAAPLPPAAPFRFPDDDAILTGKDFRSTLERAFAQVVGPQLQQTAEIASSSAYAAAMSRRPKEFEKWGPEIQQELAKLPRHLWTLDNLDQVVTFVRGKHADEYARDLAQQLVTQMDPTIRPTGGGSGPIPAQTEQKNPFESDKIPEDWKRRAKAAGISEATVREFCAANDMAPEEFWKQFEQSPMQPIVAEAGVGK